jgi:hypothetical protein
MDSDKKYRLESELKRNKKQLEQALALAIQLEERNALIEKELNGK